MAVAIEVLGVYRVPITDELFHEAMELKFGDDIPEEERAECEQFVREELSSVVLIEALVSDAENGFRVTDFEQTGSDQAPYDERFLHADGSAVYDSYKTPSESAFRVAFFLHFYDPDSPLETSAGPVKCPPIQDMPERLTEMVPYEPVG